MYYYIFDPPAGPNDYQHTQQIKEKLSALGIAGEMGSPMPGKDVRYLVENAVAKRYSTIVAVGGVALINQVAQALEPHDSVLGIIPLHEEPDIAKLIGSDTWEQAAENLKRRRVQSVKLGLLEGTGCFLTPATIEIPANEWVTFATPNFQGRQQGGTVIISPSRNPEQESMCLAVEITMGEKAPSAGFFKSLFGGKSSPSQNTTRFCTSHLKITTEKPCAVSVAGSEITQTPLTCSTQAKPVRLIVAKQSGTTA